jgi:hypothetical protein
MQNKKIQLWALSIAGYNCKVEYIEGRFSCCADLLSRLPFKANEPEDDLSDNEPDCKDNFFEVNVLNSDNFSVPPKKLAACQVKQSDELLKPFIHVDLPQEINIREAQRNDDQIRNLRNRLAKGTATVTEEKKVP